MIKIIACIDEVNALGKNNDLIYHLPNDMKRFKELTTNNIVVMGFNTYLSLPHGALPNRENYVIINKDAELDNVTILNSIDEIKNIETKGKDIYIIGGASIYLQCVDMCDELDITLVHNKCEEADVFFPKINGFNISKIEKHYRDKQHKFDYDFITYKKDND